MLLGCGTRLAWLFWADWSLLIFVLGRRQMQMNSESAYHHARFPESFTFKPLPAWRLPDIAQIISRRCCRALLSLSNNQGGASVSYTHLTLPTILRVYISVVAASL